MITWTHVIDLAISYAEYEATGDVQVYGRHIAKTVRKSSAYEEFGSHLEEYLKTLETLEDGDIDELDLTMEELEEFARDAKIKIRLT